jgi:CheY-like chemotaxis protein
MIQAVIMVVEDNQANRELAAALLTMAGYAVLEAEDGRDLLERVKRERPDLILLDLQLPYIDGLTLTRQLKADADTREIPVVAVTAYGHPDSELGLLEAGCAGYLAKPLRAQTFLQTIASLLSR